jgi:protein ImuA
LPPPHLPIASTSAARDPLAAVGGVAARKRLHAVHPDRPGQEAAAVAFGLTFALASAAVARGPAAPLLWVMERGAEREAGRPYAPGLQALGIDPSDVLVVRVRGALEALAAGELGLEETGLAGIVVELPARLPADMLKLGKRLALRAEARAVPCLLIHANAVPVEAPVATRWLVASRSVAAQPDQPPDFDTAFDLTLTKNRSGPLGRFAIGWRAVSSGSTSGDDHGPAFRPLGSPLPPRGAAGAVDRSSAAAGSAHDLSRAA